MFQFSCLDCNIIGTLMYEVTMGETFISSSSSNDDNIPVYSQFINLPSLENGYDRAYRLPRRSSHRTNACTGAAES
jgi:hypothetical protein